MAARGAGLAIEVTDGDREDYRGSLFYDLAKASAARLALALARELGPRSVTAVGITPGFLRSEAVLDHFGVTEARWHDGVAADPHFALSETPRYVGRGWRRSRPIRRRPASRGACCRPGAWPASTGSPTPTAAARTGAAGARTSWRPAATRAPPTRPPTADRPRPRYWTANSV
mgnify:FL=1